MAPGFVALYCKSLKVWIGFESLLAEAGPIPCTKYSVQWSCSLHTWGVQGLDFSTLFLRGVWLPYDSSILIMHR